MLSPEIRIQITAFVDKIKKLGQKPKSKFKLSLFLIKKMIFFQEINSYSSFETKFFEFKWNILQKFQSSDENLVKIKLSIYSKRSMKEFKNLIFFIYEKEQTFLMLISDFNQKKQAKIHQFIDAFYPSISRFYLIHDELLDILQKLEENYQYEFFTRWYIISEKFGRRPDKDIKFRKGIYFEDAFKIARRENKFIEKIRLNNFSTYFNFSNGIPYDFKITREGEISIYQGKFDKIFLFLIEKIIFYANKKYSLLKKRSRAKTVKNEIKPVIIEFLSMPFKDIEGIDTLLTVLKQYTNCSYAIIHSGNPYLEMVFVDYSDNSSFSLLTFSNRSLIIYPQLHASGAALLKLFSFITEKFLDGTLYDYEEYKKLIENNNSL